MMKDIKNLIFDFGGVLINLDRTACREAFEKLGIESIHESVLDDYRQKELYMQREYFCGRFPGQYAPFVGSGFDRPAD